MGAGPIHRVRLENGQRALLDDLRAAGALVSSVEYGSFVIAFVDESAWSSREALAASGLRLRDEMDFMVFNGHLIDGVRPAESMNAIPADEAYGNPGDANLVDDAGLYVVQFRAPVKDAWLQRLEMIGAEVVQFAPSNGYVIRMRPRDFPQLLELRSGIKDLQYVGAYHPAFKMTPSIRMLARQGPEHPVNVTIQIVKGDWLADAQSWVEGLMSEVSTVHPVGPYLNLRGFILPSRLLAVARHRAVFAIEPLGTRTRSDERQGQTMAGNFSGAQPTGPGYLSWLSSKGFNSSQFTTFAVNVVDDAPVLDGTSGPRQ